MLNNSRRSKLKENPLFLPAKAKQSSKTWNAAANLIMIEILLIFVAFTSEENATEASSVLTDMKFLKIYLTRN